MRHELSRRLHAPLFHDDNAIVKVDPVRHQREIVDAQNRSVQRVPTEEVVHQCLAIFQERAFSRIAAAKIGP